mmetsp:Transcript_23884/g.67660  ORF Transcript_23884/g.67660 Transcript_23884/m.67660 type:complete len:279 (+) Transcript_23884:35-871(+)
MHVCAPAAAMMLDSLVPVPVAAVLAPISRPVVGSAASASTTPTPGPRWLCGSGSSRPRHGSGGVSGAATVGGLAAACVASRAVLRLVAGGAHSAWGRHRRRRGGRHSAAGVSRNVGRGVKDLLHGSTKLVESSYEERKKAREEKQAALMEELLDKVARERSEAEQRSKANKTFIAAMKEKHDVLKKRVEEARAWRLLEVSLVLPGVEVKDTTHRAEEKSSSVPSSSSSSASPSTSLSAPKSKLAPCRLVFQFVRSATEAGIALVSGGSITSNKLSALN